MTHRETDESYRGVVACCDSVRVITCPDNLQWIIQRRSGTSWRSFTFHRERQSLIRCLAKLGFPLETITLLPAHYDTPTMTPQIESPGPELPLRASDAEEERPQVVLSEPLQGDDYPLDYYPDGYPKLPACLDRRPITLAEAA